MNTQEIKEYIVDNDKIEYILEELGCHQVKLHGGRYFSCAFPDGDNAGAITVYTDNIKVNSYTRNIEDKYGNSDLISLVSFIKGFYFTKSLKWICDILGLDYYKELQEELPESLKITKLILEMNGEFENSEEFENLKAIPEQTLLYYYPYGNIIFKKEGISLLTQSIFEIGYDLSTDRITIPIRDELGTLVGVKGRTFNPSYEDKYIYLVPCAKSRILYGLNLAMPFIKEKGFVIVVESEKSVLKLWEAGICNVVAIGGHILSKAQVEKLVMIGVTEIVLCYDQDVARKEDGSIDKKEYKKEANKFIEHIKVYAMVDLKNDILDNCESPADNIDKFNLLFEGRKRL